jgi:probable F420-dependent oxidoreductase
MPEALTFGLFSMNMDACGDPGAATRIARLAEAAGFDSLWAGEHVVLPSPQVPPSPMAPEERILDPLITLAFLAAQTSTIRLGTGIIVLPQRNPLVLAKELASLDALSGGRLIFGLGVGYLEPEFRALGIPFADRGARTDDYLAAMRAIWTQDEPAHEGRFVSFAGVQAHPQPKHLQIVTGGHSPGAWRRAVERADGWYGFALDLDGTARALAGLRDAASRYVRPATLGELEISVTPRRLPDQDEAARFTALGVHRLILMPPSGLDEAALSDYVSAAADTLIGRV